MPAAAAIAAADRKSGGGGGGGGGGGAVTRSPSPRISPPARIDPSRIESHENAQGPVVEGFDEESCEITPARPSPAGPREPPGESIVGDEGRHSHIAERATAAPIAPATGPLVC